EIVGSGLQLSAGSATALRFGGVTAKGLGSVAFQTGLGLTLGGLPIAAQQLGASPDLAEKLGTAAGIFIPTVLGTIGNNRTIKRAEGVMHELGVDPAKARTVMGEVFNAESKAHGDFDVERFVRERLSELGADARTTLADTLRLDKVRGRVGLEP